MAAPRALLLSGGSMRPLLSPGDVAFLTDRPPRPGDLIAYRVAGRLFVHRLAFASGGSLWAFDDAATIGWHVVPRRALAGRVEAPRSVDGPAGLAWGLASWALHRLGALR